MTNTVTGNFYIGSSKNIYGRVKRHEYLLRKGYGDNIRIKADLHQHGVGSFSFDVLEYCELPLLKEREQYYFEILRPTYNVWKSIYSAEGRTYTPEQLESFKDIYRPMRDIGSFREKLKSAWKERRMRPDGIATLAMLDRTGKLHSEETKKKYSEQRKGKPKSQAMKDKLRESRKGTKLVNGRFIKEEST
jgi:group I intron endonuclease